MSNGANQSENAETTSGRSRRATAIDWAAVVCLVFDWVVAIVEYVFSVLVFGFLGGYFGTFADFGLYFIDESWGGRGRELGWVIGALAGAIGLPLGWARIDGKKFSFPTPRKLRRRIAVTVRKRRKKKKKKSYEVCSVPDVLSYGGWLGLIGLFLGFLLGMCLMMCWFSLAMSPLSPMEWFESIRFEAVSEGNDHSIDSHRDRGSSMTSDHPIVRYLALAPMVILAALGAVLGTIYGAVEYVRYLRAVPANLRAQQKWEKRQPVVTEKDATQAAIEQDLPQLAPPPRSVPLGAYRQLLRGGVRIGLVGGGTCVLAGAIFALAIVQSWNEEPTQTDSIPVPLLVIIVIFVGIGSAVVIGSLRNWRRKAYILRHGYLACCRFDVCKGDRTGWRPFDKAFDKSYRTWHQPFATASDVGKVRVMVAMAGLFAVAFVSFFAFFAWDSWGEGWIVLMPIGMLFIAVVFLAVGTWRLRRFVFSGATPSQLGIERIVDCRFEFRLPNGNRQQAEARLYLQSRLNAGSAQPDDVAVYHPLEPKYALLLSSFSPGLEVGVAGQWRFRQSSSKRDAESDGPMVYITPSGKSYHREDCRFVGNRGSAAPLQYAKRYYEPCDACQPPEA